MTDEVLTDAGAQTVASFGNEYDADGNLTSKTVGLPGNPRSGSHSFDYEHQGLLEVWSGPGGTVSYSWNDRGNRETAGSDVYTYDERNRMLSGPDGTYQYTPRGTLTSVGGSSYDFDPFGRLTGFSDGATSVVYSYDGLDRVAARDGTAFTFAGAEWDPAPRLVGWDRISSVELARRGEPGSIVLSRRPSGKMLLRPSWYRDDQGDSPQNLESLIRERWEEARRAR